MTTGLPRNLFWIIRYKVHDTHSFPWCSIFGMGHNCLFPFCLTLPHLHLSLSAPFMWSSLQDLSLNLDKEVCMTRDTHESESIGWWLPFTCIFLSSRFLVSSPHARSLPSTKVCMIHMHVDYPVRRFAWSTGTPLTQYEGLHDPQACWLPSTKAPDEHRTTQEFP